MRSLLQALQAQPTEFEVHSDCYQYLKQHYPIVRGEVKLQFDRVEKYTRRPRGARFDLVVCNEQALPLFIVEVKRKERETNASKTAHYETVSGVKCYTVGSLAQCEVLIKSL